MAVKFMVEMSNFHFVNIMIFDLCNMRALYYSYKVVKAWVLMNMPSMLSRFPILVHLFYQPIALNFYCLDTKKWCLNF